ncbi:cytochrome oxidase assembly protein ShyY1 [Tamilnaduibacter salinus]|uniref:SURF1-like protein n=1 Tax=Tamilnaduibacter salinus TaxID=1484056 RepID=A0A2A2I718_9GAMM|nr:SURF1 family protein [Tamilnaduibacter salinus]PAV26915.1 hypothetical protein CF392_03675 [Tamilnaduibacter salinus]PVY77426.1 cytochrome oxidase assembly protein ShyY1 [Tamilnaduibacter salinus]
MSTAPPSSLRRRWRFDWRLWLFTGLLFPVLVSLSVWQWQRAGEKEQRMDQWQQTRSEAPWRALQSGALTAGQPIRIQGRYRPGPLWLLDNRTRNGQSGYEVLSLFEPMTGDPVLVNRGWVPAPRRRDALPSVRTPTGMVTIRARVADYPTPPVIGETTVSTSWPRRVQSLPRERVRDVAPTVAAVSLRLDGADQPGAFRADWELDVMGPGTHYGYAGQWALLAALLLTMTLVASYRKPEQRTDSNHG